MNDLVIVSGLNIELDRIVILPSHTTETSKFAGSHLCEES